ncbi:hypothetical protein [Acanthopleuribacter pedis]|uniref:Uncharacterized protein n=1 Tax=Acanthopleuribacter pedis TaxID=442870 RepID=A0A8J7U2I7_9BACT|nr:hypothetical protein [Acanthopleuribacter pedis]MBO1317759.1 hypothetical protein [Acanthopleuribacter pedis]
MFYRPVFFLTLLGMALTVHPWANAQKTIPVPWDDTMADYQPPFDAVSEEDVVVIHVTHFNFLRFNLEADINTEQVVAYRELNDLWGQVFGFDIAKQLTDQLKPNSNQLAPQVDLFFKAMAEWREKLETQSEVLTEQNKKYPNIFLTVGEVAEIAKVVDKISTGLAEMAKVKQAAWKQTLPPATNQESLSAHVLFFLQAELHNDVTAQMEEFIRLGTMCIRGKRIPVPKVRAGSLVNVVLKGKALDSSDEIARVEFSYFVKSKFPLIFHVGYAYSKLADVEFDQLQTLLADGGENPFNGSSEITLYNRIKDEEASQEMTAFLSYEFPQEGKPNQAFMLGVGTDLEDVGSKIYVAGSYRFKKRWVVSIGGVTGDVVQGVDEQGNETGPDLFQTIEKAEEWGGFAAISLTLF